MIDAFFKSTKSITFKGLDDLDIANKPKIKPKQLTKLWMKKERIFRKALSDILAPYFKKSS